jgi:hypothetical protein
MLALNFEPRIEAVTVGTRLICDGEFACLDEGAKVVVESHECCLIVRCREGVHYIDGNTSDDGTHYVGFAIDPEQPK